MTDCIFCKIIKGEIPAKKTFEDSDVVVFLDANPLTLGHCLVVPKSHFENIFDINQEILSKVMATAKNISVKIKESPGVLGVNLINNNGSDAGQKVFHFHVHIIPRYKKGEMVKIAASMDLAEMGESSKEKQ